MLTYLLVGIVSLVSCCTMKMNHHFAKNIFLFIYSLLVMVSSLWFTLYPDIFFCCAIPYFYLFLFIFLAVLVKSFWVNISIVFVFWLIQPIAMLIQIYISEGSWDYINKISSLYPPFLHIIITCSHMYFQAIIYLLVKWNRSRCKLKKEK